MECRNSAVLKMLKIGLSHAVESVGSSLYAIRNFSGQSLDARQSPFPTYIEVSDKSVSRRKRSWFRMDEMSMSISKVASVHIKTGLIWSEILIESSGGSDPLASHGHKKGDAQRIKD